MIAVDDLTRRRQVPQPARRRASATTSTGATSTTASPTASFGHVDARVPRGRLLRHDGARRPATCSTTTTACSKTLLDACQAQGTRLLYASSAATYGGSATFREEPRVRAAAQRLRLLQAAVRPASCAAMLPTAHERRSRAFATSTSTARASSTRAAWPSSPSTSSTSSAASGQVKLFGEYGGYGAGRAARDFVFVDDVVAVNLWFLEHPEASGIFNLGTGRAQPFNDVALAVVNACRAPARRAAAAARRAGRRRRRSSTSTSRRRWSASTSATPRPTSTGCAPPAATTPSSMSPPASPTTSPGCSGPTAE